MIARAAALHGSAPAVIQGERSWTFGQFRQRVDALAAGLAGLGLAKGDRICVLAQNDVAYLEPTVPAPGRASSPIRSTGGSRARKSSGSWSAPRPA